MTDVPPVDCRVDGAKHLAPSVSELEICEAFGAQLVQSLGEGRNGDEFSVLLKISGSGTIDAYVTDGAGASVTPYENVSIDVMDRPPGIGDVVKLAETVASLIRSE